MGNIGNAERTVLVNIVYPSRCHRVLNFSDTTLIRWRSGVYMMSCCLRNTIGQHRVSYVLPLCSKTLPLVPIITRQKCDHGSPDLIRCHQDGFVKVKMYMRIQHEIEPSCVLRTVFGMTKILVSLAMVLPKALKISRRTNDGKRCTHE